jgi:hypothetical protein
MEIRAAAGANASALATGFQFTYAGAHLVAVSAGQGESAEAIAAEALDAVRAHDTLISETALSESAHAMAWDVQQRVAPRIPNLSIPTCSPRTSWPGTGGRSPCPSRQAAYLHLALVEHRSLSSPKPATPYTS